MPRAKFNNGRFHIGEFTTVAEDFVAAGRKLLFPRIQTCQAIICAQANGVLVGTHLTVHSEKETVSACFDLMNEHRSTGAPAAIYLIGTYGKTSPLGGGREGQAFAGWDGSGCSDVRWPKVVKTMRKRFGTCPVYVFDKGQNFVHIKATGCGERSILEHRLQQHNEMPGPADDFAYLHPKDLVPA